MIPHVTDAIKAFARADTDDLDFVLCEIGGTVGDIESLPFIEAIRQLSNDLGRGKSIFVHVTLVPYIAAAGELKTKPTQHSVRDLTALGIQPDVLVCRCEQPLPAGERAKIALFCNVPHRGGDPRARRRDRSTRVPLQYHAEGLDAEVLRAFGIDAGRDARSAPLDRHHRSASTNPEGEVTIGVVGKYVGLQDAYKSLHEALVHGGIANRVKVNIRWLDAELFEGPEADVAPTLEPMHGILVPGGFGERGSEGKIAAVRFARERERAVSSASASACRWPASKARGTPPGIAKASTTEFGPTDEPVVGLITEWMSRGGLQKREAGGDLGGTMRLGAYDAKLAGNSHVASIYGGTDDLRAPSPPLRGQRPLSRAAGKGRARLLRHVARRRAARDRRAARPSLVRRRAVPSRS